jgi:hypothetical protein
LLLGVSAAGLAASGFGAIAGAGRVSPICGLRTSASLAACALTIFPSRGGSGSSIGTADDAPADWRLRLRFLPPRRPRRRFFAGELPPADCSGPEAPALTSLIFLLVSCISAACAGINPRSQPSRSRTSPTDSGESHRPGRSRDIDLWKGDCPSVPLRLPARGSPDGLFAGPFSPSAGGACARFAPARPGWRSTRGGIPHRR